MTQQIRLSLPQWAIDNVVLLNVRLNDRTLIRMILDTGAKYTVITPDVARRLGLDLQGARRVPVTTATQLEMAALTTVDQIDVQGLVLRDVETAVINLPTALGVEGLLGMSFLRKCRMLLDVPNRLFELETS
jgi:clan AA aspartic protease (TIGR02281 family)